MKKSTLAIIAVVIIIIILLLFKGCDSFKRPSEETEEEVSIDLTQYRTPFIEANIDFSCQILEDETILQDNKISKELLNKSYADNQLPVEHDLLMIQILELYEDDSSVIQEIRNGVKEC